MPFHLNHTPQKPGFSLNHSHSSFLIGSCFSGNIAALLEEHKFNTLSNPDGILFNPASIADSLKQIIEQKKIDERFFLQKENQFYSYKHHSSFHSDSKNELIETLNDTNKKNHEFLRTADYLFITFGTAFYYHHLALNTGVANCHKQPGNVFEKRLLKVHEIVSEYMSLLDTIQKLNNKIKLIFTVSPVKHLKDGLVENTISKSTLHLAVHELASLRINCSYFPAFELINDDLRDYRFYKEDMVHPTQQAVDYVWQKFSDCYFDPKTQELNKEIRKLNLALNHRQMAKSTSESEKLKKFIEKQKKAILNIDPKISL